MPKSVTLLLLSFFFVGVVFASDNYTKAYQLAASNPEEATKLAHEALLEFVSDNNYNKTINTYWLLAYIQENKYEYVKAADYYFKALKVANDHLPERTPQLLHMIGNCYYMVGLNTQALRLYEPALIAYDNLGLPQSVADVTYSAAVTYIMLDQLDTAANLLIEAEHLYGIAAEERQANILFSRGMIEQKKGNYTAAIAHYEKAKHISKENRTQSNCQNNIASTLYEMGDTVAAYNAFLTAEKISLNPNAIVLLNIAHIHFEMGSLSESLLYVEKVVSTSEKEFIRKAFKIARDIYLIEGEKDKAEEQADNIISIGDTLLLELKQLRAEMNQIEMLLLQAEYDSKEAANSHREELRWWWLLGSFIAGMLLCVAAYFAMRTIKYKSKAKEYRIQRDNNRKIALDTADKAAEHQQRVNRLVEIIYRPN